MEKKRAWLGREKSEPVALKSLAVGKSEAALPGLGGQRARNGALRTTHPRWTHGAGATTGHVQPWPVLPCSPLGTWPRFSPVPGERQRWGLAVRAASPARRRKTSKLSRVSARGSAFYRLFRQLTSTNQSQRRWGGRRSLLGSRGKESPAVLRGLGDHQDTKDMSGCWG